MLCWSSGHNLQCLVFKSDFTCTDYIFITSKMSGFEPTKQHMREAMVFVSIFKKVLLKVIACFRKRVVNMLYLRQRAEIGLDGLKMANSTLKRKNVQDSRKNWTMKTWRGLKQWSNTLNVTETTVSKFLHNLRLV